MNKHLLFKMNNLLVVLMMFVGVLSAQTPELLADTTYWKCDDGTVCVGKKTKLTINIMGDKLIDDIILSVDSKDVTLSRYKIAKTSEIVDVEVCVSPLKINDIAWGEEGKASLTISSTGAESLVIPITWWTYPTAKNLAEAKNLAIKNSPSYPLFDGIIVGDVTVTKDYKIDLYRYAYIQDANNAESCGLGAVPVAKDNDVYKYMHLQWSKDGYVIYNYGELISNGVSPKEVTIEELNNNPTAYANWLVKLTDVTFKDKGWNFGGQMQIEQGELNLWTDIFDGSDLSTVKIPETADITGIFNIQEIEKNKYKNFISLRSKADVVDKSTSTEIEDINKELKVWSVDNMLMVDMKEMSDVEVYNTVGQCMDIQKGVVDYKLHVEKGIYLVRVNGEVIKTIVK